jgi:hypothetical protein
VTMTFVAMFCHVFLGSHMAWTKLGVLSGAKLLVLGNLRADLGLGVTILDGFCQLCPRGDTLRWTKLTELGVKG